MLPHKMMARGKRGERLYPKKGGGKSLFDITEEKNCLWAFPSIHVPDVCAYVQYIKQILAFSVPRGL